MATKQKIKTKKRISNLFINGKGEEIFLIIPMGTTGTLRTEGKGRVLIHFSEVDEKMGFNGVELNPTEYNIIEEEKPDA